MIRSSAYRHVPWLLPLIAFGGWLLLDHYFLRVMSLFPMLLLCAASGLAAIVAAVRRRPWRLLAMGSALSLAMAAVIFRDAVGANAAARTAIDALRAAHACAPTIDDLRAADPDWARLETPAGTTLRKHPRGPLGTPQVLLYWRQRDGSGIARVGVLDAGETYRDFPACAEGAPVNPPRSPSPR